MKGEDLFFAIAIFLIFYIITAILMGLIVTLLGGFSAATLGFALAGLVLGYLVVTLTQQGDK